MFTIDRNKLKQFQENLGYKFKNEQLLEQALTTPQMANMIGKPSYEFLETLGDAIIKVILILKLYQQGIDTPSQITKIKSSLESDKNLKNISNSMNLHDYIIKTEKQKINGTSILADVFEALCGAIFLDSEKNLKKVEEKIINPYFKDFKVNTQNIKISSKNELLEFLQNKFKTSVLIDLEYEKRGLEHDPIWIVKNPKIIDKASNKSILKISKTIKSEKFKSKKDAEKDIYAKILDYLKTKKK